MATLGFHVHTDKENDTPALRPIVDNKFNGKSLKTFPKGGSKLTQPTPRKALGSVNNQLPSVSSSHGIKGLASNCHQGPVQALFKPKKVKNINDENLPAGHLTKKSKAKSSPVVHTGLKKPSAHTGVKAKASKTKPKPSVQPIPVVPDDVEYDSDTILPHSDRLSCYIERLLTWRPPCLFGTIPDSDSDHEDVLDEDLNDLIEMDPPSFNLFEHDDQDLPQDLSELLVDLPSLSSSHHCSESSPIRNISPDLAPLNDQSLDSSLHLGQLHFETVTPEPSLDCDSVAHNSSTVEEY